MRRKVHRSLDRPAAVFGIRGRFLYVFGLIAAVALVAGLAFGRAVSTLLGFVVALAGFLAAYLLTVSLQSRIDGRDLWKLLAGRGLPSVYRTRPMHVRNIWRGCNLPSGTETHSDPWETES